KRPVIVVVPVKDENVDAMFSSRVDLLGHLDRIGLVRIAPERLIWLMLAWETRFCRLDELPFTPPVALDFFYPRIARMVVAEIIACDRDPRITRANGRGQ